MEVFIESNKEKRLTISIELCELLRRRAAGGDCAESANNVTVDSCGCSTSHALLLMHFALLDAIWWLDRVMARLCSMMASDGTYYQRFAAFFGTTARKPTLQPALHCPLDSRFARILAHSKVTFADGTAVLSTKQMCTTGCRGVLGSLVSERCNGDDELRMSPACHLPPIAVHKLPWTATADDPK